MTKRTIALFLVLNLVLSCLPTAQAKARCASLDPVTSKQYMQDALNTWVIAIRSRDSDTVNKLYKDDAVLLPTLSSKVAHTPDLRKDYFDHFLALQNLDGTINEEHIQIFCDTAINIGLYTFSFIKDNQKIIVPARFSFVFHKTPKGWMIVDHHSSIQPQE